MSRENQKAIRSGDVIGGVLLAVAGLILFGYALSLVEQALPADIRPTVSQLRFSGSVVGASFLIFFAAGLYAAAGIGGNSFYSATFIVLLKMSPHTAIPLAYFATFGMSVGSFAFLVRSRHPFADRPLIDYLLCLVLESLTLLGTVFGVMLNLVFPGVVLIVLLAVVLAITAWRTLKRAVETRRKENTFERENVCVPLLEITAVFEETKQDARVTEIVREEASFPWRVFFALVAVWAMMSLFIILQGGDSNHRSVIGVHCGSWQYGLLLGALILFLILVSGAELLYVRRRHAHKLDIGFPFLSGDLQWNGRNVLLWPLAGVAVGLVAGFVGIAGGILQGPLLLEMGVMPQVAAASTSFMILFTSSSISVQYLVYGSLDVRLGAWFFAIGIVAAFFGQIVLDAAIRRYKRQSLVAFLLGSLIVFSAATMLSLDIYRLASGAFNFSFGSVCNPAHS